MSPQLPDDETYLLSKSKLVLLGLGGEPMNNYQTDTQRWQAVSSRDKEADKEFVYAVLTTGIVVLSIVSFTRGVARKCALLLGCVRGDWGGVSQGSRA